MGASAHSTAHVGPLQAGLVGAGIGPSLSPALHEHEGAHLGLDYRYERFELAGGSDVEDELLAALAAARALGAVGVNVTHPVKQRVMDHVDELADEARAVGAVNTVVFGPGRTVGHNTDVTGFRAGVERGLAGSPLGTVVLVGAGGAGAAAACALLALGTRRLLIVDRDAERADALAARLADGDAARVRVRAPDEAPALVAAADGVVNATPSGMAGAPGLPFDPEALHAGLWVADLVYRPLRTPLLRAAHARGCRTLDGGEMAVVQAAESVRLFTGLVADRERMRAHFERLVHEERGAA